MLSKSSSRPLVCRHFCFALGGGGPDPRRLFRRPRLGRRHHWGYTPPCTSSASRADGAPAGPDSDLPQLARGCPPDPLQDAVSPLLGPHGPTSREQANREAGVAHSTASTPQELASARGELQAQPHKHPTRCPPPGHSPDPTPKPPARPLPGSQTPAESTRTQAGKMCRRQL